MAEEINLHKIVEMPEKEFRKHIYNWLRDKDLSRELQAKLRKNLIENFNNTRLGKIINVQHNRKQKLFKSPLNLILNTLVAEHLYVENCHYTLSVFCAEMPNEIVPPNLESRTDFRFSKENLIEIFEAFGNGSLNERMRNIVLDNYMQDDSEEKPISSLLYVIFETMEICIDHFNNILRNKTNVETTPQPVEKDFQQWFSEVKNTKSGKEFLSKLESSIQKILLKQKHCMLRKFEKKLENEKKKLKIRYKQHYLNSERFLEMKNTSTDGLQSNPSKNIMQFSEKPNEFKDFSKSLHVEVPDGIAHNENNIVGSSKNGDELNLEKSKQELSRIIEYEKNLLERHSRRTQQEKCIDSIVHEARLKIQELENESLKIDGAFKTHLLSQRDHHDKSKQNRDITAIFEAAADVKIEQKDKTFSISNDEDGYDTTNSIVFENPFKETQNKVSAKLRSSQNKNLKENYYLGNDKDTLKNNELETKNTYLPITVEYREEINDQQQNFNKTKLFKSFQDNQKEEMHTKKNKQPFPHNESDSKAHIEEISINSFGKTKEN
ncbi:titin homolog [Condylostylus longicornis]|uniref:titin homolog n=1 Tax=Condylostylus longicornis TaxID=2530218 RepID=UPI00244E4899|nr:titin homolog [Condylostylus longicornis]